MKYLIIGLIVGLTAGLIIGFFLKEGFNEIFNLNHNSTVNGQSSLLRTYKPDAGERTLTDIINRNRSSGKRIERIGIITNKFEANNKDLDLAIDRAKVTYDTNQAGIGRVKEGLKVLYEGIDRFKKLYSDPEKGK